MTYLAAANIDGWVDLDRTDRQFSPTFVFNQANAFKLERSRFDACELAGSFMTDALTLLRDTGCTTWADVPYTVGDCETAPDEEARARAADFRIAYFRAVERDVATIQTYLNAGIPVVVILRIGDAFGLLGPGDGYDVVEDDESHTYLHAVLAVGYDDDLGAIKIMNSWGTGWGDGGFGFIDYDVWESINTEAYIVGAELVTPITSVIAEARFQSGREAPLLSRDREEAVLSCRQKPFPYGRGSDQSPRSRMHSKPFVRAQAIPGELPCRQNPLLDTDRDGYPDTLEIEFGLAPTVPDDNPDFVPAEDTDTDGWPDETEAAFGADPADADDFPYGCDYAYPSGFFDVFLGLDQDADRIRAAEDNCPTVPNTDQADEDDDGVGDVCDGCPSVANLDQADTDTDGLGDACDNCPLDFNAGQLDVDGDGVGNVCDNCLSVPNPAQVDADSDGVGDVCDNCPEASNPDQADFDTDGIGDACEPPGAASGACCLPDGSCVVVTAASCNSLLGSYGGDGTACAPTLPCPKLLGVEAGDGTLWGISPVDATAEVILELGLTDVQGLTQRSGAGPVFYAVRDPSGEDPQLWRINPAAGEIVSIGSISGFDEISGLAYVAPGGALYGITSDTGRVLEIGQTSAEATQLTELFLAEIHSLAFDSDTGLLYAAAEREGSDPAALYRFGPHDSTAVFVGVLSGYSEVAGMTFFEGRLYAIGVSTGPRLLAIQFVDGEPVIEDRGALPNVDFGALAAYDGS